MLRFLKLASISFAMATTPWMGAQTNAQDEFATNAAGRTTAAQDDPRLLSPEELRRRDVWRETMSAISLPEEGCFNASYPTEAWRKVDCGEPRPYPMPPNRGPRPFVIGNTNDIAAGAPSGFISTAIGTFDSVTGVTSVNSPNGSGAPVNNAYSLQINTNFFTSPACAGSTGGSCQGWQQFVYSNNGSNGLVFIQYWLLRYNATCPSGWIQFSFTGSSDIYCYRNGNLTPVPNQPIGNLAQLTLRGDVSATADSVTFSTASNMYSATGLNAVAASSGWQAAEFNIFGNGGDSSGGGQANFNAGSTIVPRTRIFYGGQEAPNCLAQGFTGETNNLNFGPTAPASSAPGPAVFFTESSAGGATTNCAAATTIGDTHLHTFQGLFYDFQASGDFVLADVDPGFLVHARQVSGAPTWPDTSVNNGVATRMGDTHVAVCLDEAPLVIDGERRSLRDGETTTPADGVDVTRMGNVYWVRDRAGNSVRAEVRYPTHINASVGLGKWPTNARGLLANVKGNVSQIATADGEVLTTPFAFEDLYGAFADSWRVRGEASLLNVCGDDVENGVPERPFYAKDLDPNLYAETRAICVAAGVAPGPLLDACTLDVAVIGDSSAADVFVTERRPIAEAIVVATSGGGKQTKEPSFLGKEVWLGGPSWCDLVVALLFLGSILLVLLGRSASGPLNLIKWVTVLAGWALAAFYWVIRFGLIAVS